VTHNAEVTHLDAVSHSAEVAAPVNVAAAVVLMWQGARRQDPWRRAPCHVRSPVPPSLCALSLSPFRRLSLGSLSSLHPHSRISGAVAAAPLTGARLLTIIVAATVASADQRGRRLRSLAPPLPAPPRAGLGAGAQLPRPRSARRVALGRPRRGGRARASTAAASTTRRPVEERGWDFLKQARRHGLWRRTPCHIGATFTVGLSPRHHGLRR
jgi:hypothetical protein